MIFVTSCPICACLDHFNLTSRQQPFTLYDLLTLQKGMVSRTASHNEAGVRDALYSKAVCFDPRHKRENSDLP